MSITTFKPYHLEQCEAKKVLNKKNLIFLILIWIACIITPFTNWIGIIASKYIKLFYEVW